MEITKVLKPFIRRGANTFGNIVLYKYLVVSPTFLSDIYCQSITLNESVLYRQMFNVIFQLSNLFSVCNNQTPGFERSVALKAVVDNSLARFCVKRAETVILYFPVSNTV